MNSPHIQGGYDLKWYENISLGSIIGMVIFLGVYTFPLQGIERSLMPITAKYMDKSNDF
jgi:hypothetical protein